MRTHVIQSIFGLCAAFLFAANVQAQCGDCGGCASGSGCVTMAAESPWVVAAVPPVVRRLVRDTDRDAFAVCDRDANGPADHVPASDANADAQRHSSRRAGLKHVSKRTP